MEISAWKSSLAKVPFQWFCVLRDGLRARWCMRVGGEETSRGLPSTLLQPNAMKHDFHQRWFNRRFLWKFREKNEWCHKWKDSASSVQLNNAFRFSRKARSHGISKRSDSKHFKCVEKEAIDDLSCDRSSTNCSDGIFLFATVTRELNSWSWWYASNYVITLWWLSSQISFIFTYNLHHMRDCGSVWTAEVNDEMTFRRLRIRSCVEDRGDKSYVIGCDLVVASNDSSA